MCIATFAFLFLYYNRRRTLFPRSMLSRLLERTRLVIKTKELPGGPVGLPAVAVLNPAVRDVIVRCFQELDAPSKRLLGIDSWSVQ